MDNIKKSNKYSMLYYIQLRALKGVRRLRLTPFFVENQAAQETAYIKLEVPVK